MKFVLYFLSGIAAVGAALCAITHLAALTGQKGPLGDQWTFLFYGLFPMLPPMVLAANRLSRDVPPKDLGKAALRGCPTWMKYALCICASYSLVNFALVKWAKSGANEPALQTELFFSGHILTFYFAAMAILYSAATLWDNDGIRRCSEGHAVGPLAKFCDQCGRPIPGSRLNARN